MYVCLQDRNKTITHSLQQTQLSVEQYLQESDQLRSQLALLQQQQSAVMEDKARVTKDNKMLSVQVAELQVTEQGLEATKEQLIATLHRPVSVNWKRIINRLAQFDTSLLFFVLFFGGGKGFRIFLFPSTYS